MDRRYYASKTRCSTCALKEQCTSNKDARIVSRYVHEAAHDKAHQIAKTDAYTDASRRRKKVAMLFAHLKKIMRLDRLRPRGPNGGKENSASQQPPKISANSPNHTQWAPRQHKINADHNKRSDHSASYEEPSKTGGSNRTLDLNPAKSAFCNEPGMWLRSASTPPPPKTADKHTPSLHDLPHRLRSAQQSTKNTGLPCTSPAEPPCSASAP